MIKNDTPLSKNTKVPLTYKLYYVFLRVGVTKYCKLQYKMLPGSANGLGNDPRPFSNTVRTPTV